LQKVELTSRVKVLKSAHLNLEHLKYRKSIQKLSIFTDKKVEQEPIVIRKAKALALYLDEMPPLIMKNELIVGSQTLFGPPGVSSFSLTSQEERFSKLRYVDADDIGGAAGMGGPESHPEPGRTLPDSSSYTRIFPEYYTKKELEEAEGQGLSRFGLTTGHNVPGYHRVLSLGYKGMREEALTRIQQLQAERDSKKIAFLQAIAKVMEAASRYLMRLALKAEILAEENLDLRRRRELEKIAAVCRWISENPPRTFHEALQLFWTTHMITKVSQGCIYLGRFDQYIYSFLKEDLDTARLTKEEAQELLECAWIKLNEGNHLSQNSCCNLMLSGQNRVGKDATNELTYMCLDAYDHLELADPKVNVRIHKKSPIELERRCTELIKKGGSFPALYNDEVIIPALLKIGIPIEDARDYCMDGCQEITIGGKSDFYPVFAPQINFLKLVLRALNMRTIFADFSEFLDTYKTAVATAIKRSVMIANRRDAALSKIAPCPFLSATIEGCVNKVKDKTEGGCT
jgi:formate C-acetyltransferase